MNRGRLATSSGNTVSSSRLLWGGIITIALVLLLGGGFLVVKKGLEYRNKKEAERREYQKRVVAVVNGKEISRKEYDRRVEVMTYLYTNVSSEPERLRTLKHDQLEFLIKLALLEEFLKERAQPLTGRELDEYTEKVAQEFGGIASYQNVLEKGYASTLDDVRLNFREELLLDKIAGAPGKKHVYGIWFNRTRSLETPPDVVKGFRVIEENIPEEDRPTYERVKSVYARSASGEDFSDLAREFSEDFVSRAKGGEIGWIESLEGAYGTRDAFPVSSHVVEAWEHLAGGKVALYGYSNGFSVMKVVEAEEGVASLTGDLLFDEWYAELRNSADIRIFDL